MYLQAEVTTTDQVFSMNLSHAGDYAGKFQDEAIDALFADDDYMWIDDSWADFMISNDGVLYAVKADGMLTEHNINALVAEVPRDSYDSIWSEALQKLV